MPDFDLAGKKASDEVVALNPLLAPPPEEIPVPPKPRLVSDVLGWGTLIVVSKASQDMYVFRNGNLWKSSPVSTGKRGKETPSGVFAILQKKEFHRSNLYNNAPMPFMQRLTWDGIAIHAGAIPGYPASHGCIRVPKDFAEELFEVTGYASTGVIVVDEALADEWDALAIAKRSDAAIPIHPSMLPPRRRAARSNAKPAAPKSVAQKTPAQKTPAKQTPAAESARGEQTIQLAALSSKSEAESTWRDIKSREPQLSKARISIQHATVNAREYYRLRVSAPNAHAMCAELNRSGVACMPVT